MKVHHPDLSSRENFLQGMQLADSPQLLHLQNLLGCSLPGLLPMTTVGIQELCYLCLMRVILFLHQILFAQNLSIRLVGVSQSCTIVRGSYHSILSPSLSFFTGIRSALWSGVHPCGSSQENVPHRPPTARRLIDQGLHLLSLDSHSQVCKVTILFIGCCPRITEMIRQAHSSQT